MPSVVDEVVLWTVFVVGALFGSFINVVGYRVPRGESIVSPGSHCPNCARPLKPYELIPILSWLLLVGRCRTCKHPISARYPAIEACTAVLFAVTYMTVPGWSARCAWALFWLLLMAVVATDLTSLRVPDVLSLPGAIVSFILSIATGVQSFEYALGGTIACVVVMWLIHILSKGNMGLGDVKLYASIGAMLGPLYGLASLIFACFFGAAVGLVLRVTGRVGKRQPIAFVPFIAMGVGTATYFGPAICNAYVGLILHA